MSFNFDEDKLLADPAELLGVVKYLYQKVEEQEERISELEIENQSLKSELAKYTSPHISSSKQLYPKKQSGLPRSSSKKKRGGSKKGKSGVTWDEKPDEVIHNYVDVCLECNNEASRDDQSIAYSKRILEIPEKINVELQEHHIYKYECQCGKSTQAADVTLDGTSLGPNFLSFLTCVRKRTGASFENVSLMIEDVSGRKPSQTILNRGLSVVTQVLKPVRDTIAREVMNSEFINIDETGHKLVLEGKRAEKGSKKIWVWVFATQQAAYYHVDLKRAKTAIETALKYHDEDKPPPISISDAYPAYLNMFETKQYCWAHLLRDTKEQENVCLAAKILHDQMVNLFQKIKALQKKLRMKNEPASEKVYQNALIEINALAEARSCENIKKIQNHLKNRGELYLTCLKYPQIPMENGRAERLLKSVIVHRSNGKPLRSIQAMDEYGILLTVLTTWKLRDLPIGDTLREYIRNNINPARLLD
ncbi:MAG: transposase [Candidatus Heimdallarchaeota archaeon]|nr:transposase [Candidatus Heimdallarchaeota archaeon]